MLKKVEIVSETQMVSQYQWQNWVMNSVRSTRILAKMIVADQKENEQEKKEKIQESEYILQGTLTRCKSQFFIIFTWKDSRGQYKVLIKKIRCQWAFYDHIIKIEKIIKKCKKILTQGGLEPSIQSPIACNKTTTLWLHILY